MTSLVISASGGDTVWGVANETASSPSMSNIQATASGGSVGNCGVQNAGTSAPIMTTVKASASGGRIVSGCITLVQQLL